MQTLLSRVFANKETISLNSSIISVKTLKLGIGHYGWLAVHDFLISYMLELKLENYIQVS
jgi:hypothetical protein